MTVFAEHLDHIVYAARDLDMASAAFEELTGVQPAYGGAHGGGLSHNSVVSLGPTCYLEIFAPMPGVTEGYDWIEVCQTLETPRLLTYCMRTPAGLEAVADELAKTNFGRSPVEDWSRKKPNGELLRWRLYEPDPKLFDFQFPFFIDWGDTPSPATDAPRGASLQAFTIAGRHAAELNNLFERIALPGATLRSADTLSFSLELKTPKGLVELN